MNSEFKVHDAAASILRQDLDVSHRGERDMCPALTDKELGVVQAVLDRYNREWLPALIEMKARVDRGETLNDRDAALLKKAMDEAKGGIVFARKHTEYQPLVEDAIKLYDYIGAKNRLNTEAE